MDPWSTCQTPLKKSPVNGTETVTLTFEDNFQPLIRYSLPDSVEYLAALESRLQKLKSNPDVLRQLAEKREACMRQLLCTDKIYADQNLQLDEPIEDSPILRAVAPHRQALTHGETVELVRYDQLGEEKREE